MRVGAVLAAVLCLGVLRLPVLAHHSTSSMYDESRTIEVSGKILEWRFVNPHPTLMVEVTGSDGKTENWDLSFGGLAVSHMRRQGYTPQTFKAGEVIKARGNPARSETSRGLLVRGGITRPDGTPVLGSNTARQGPARE
jgi:hypothetical protein